MTGISFAWSMCLAIFTILFFVLFPLFVLHLIIAIPTYFYIGCLQVKGVVDKKRIDSMGQMQQFLLPYKVIKAKLFHEPFPY